MSNKTLYEFERDRPKYFAWNKELIIIWVVLYLESESAIAFFFFSTKLWCTKKMASRTFDSVGNFDADESVAASDGDLYAERSSDSAKSLIKDDQPCADIDQAYEESYKGRSFFMIVPNLFCHHTSIV